jgi:hypothetical protein
VRYRQLTDNLVDAMAYHMKQLEEGCSAGAKQSFIAEQVRRHQETPQVGRLLSLYVDDSVADPTPFRKSDELVASFGGSNDLDRA